MRAPRSAVAPAMSRASALADSAPTVSPRNVPVSARSARTRARRADGSGPSPVHLVAEGQDDPVTVRLAQATDGERGLGEQVGPVRPAGVLGRPPARLEGPGLVGRAASRVDEGDREPGPRHPALLRRAPGRADVQGLRVEGGALLEREPPHRVVRGAHERGHRQTSVTDRSGDRGGRTVPGEIGEQPRTSGRAGAAGRLEGVGGRTMEAGPLEAGQVGDDRVADEGVDEPLFPAVVGGLDEPGRRGGVELGDAVRRVLPDHVRQDRDREPPSEDGRRAQDRPHRSRQLLDPTGDHLPDARRGVGDAAIPVDDPGQLADEEGVAAGGLVHGRGRPRIERAADEIVELGSDRVDVEAGELEPLRVWLPDETDEDVVGRPGRDRGHPAGREYEDPRPGQLPDQVTQEQHGGTVGGLQVVEDEDETGGSRSVPQVAADAVEDPEAGLGAALVGGRSTWPPAGGRVPEHVARAARRPQHLPPRPVGRGAVVLHSPAPGHRDPAGGGPGRELLGEPGLADPRLTGTQHAPGVPVEGGGEPGLEEPDLLGPPAQSSRHVARTPVGESGERRPAAASARVVGRSRPARATFSGDHPGPRIGAGPRRGRLP